MAKRARRTASTVTEFRTGMPYLIRDGWLAMLSRFGSLLEADRVSQIEDALTAHLSKNGKEDLPPAYDQPFIGYTKFVNTLSAFVSRGLNMLTTANALANGLQMVQPKDPSSMQFRIGNPNWKMIFGATNIPGAEYAFDTNKPFDVIINLLNEVGNIDLARRVPFDKLALPADFEQPVYHRSATVDGANILGRPANEKSTSLAKIGIVEVFLDCQAVVTDDNLTITPWLNFELDRSLYDTMVELEGSKQEPLYAYMWMMQAATAAGNSTAQRKWKGDRVVDLRSVSKKLTATKTNFGAANPRVNADGFGIGGEGLPMFLPTVDNSVEYVNEISKSTKLDENGIYDFATSHLKWANKVLLVDWFNDYILYTDPAGYLKSSRLLGLRKLDAGTEMMFLESPINASSAMKRAMEAITSVAAENTTPQEAAQFLPADVKDRWGEDLPQLWSALERLSTRVMINREASRSSFSNSRVPAFKHVIGLDMDEADNESVHQQFKDYGLIVRAYLRALYRKRSKLDIPVMTRINGFEYLMYAAEKYADDNAWIKRRQEHSEYVQRLNSNRPVTDTMDFPNLEVGQGNLSALLPHQVRYLNAMYDGVDAGIGAIATGGGKGVVSLLDIIQQLDKGEVKRPLLVTKPRLVKENITELNRISKGKINAIPLRTRTIRHLKAKAGLKTAKDFLNWVRNLPPNTIFVCAYSDFGTRSKLFDDLDVPGRVLWYNVHLSQMVHLLRLINIDMVYGDEAHLIKNMKSVRSVCSYSVFAGAEKTRVASGTLTPNLPRDLVGEMFALNPVIFGDDIDDFEKAYSIKAGQVTTDDAARRINARMTELSRYFSADEEDWSFVLPIFKDQIVHYTMTPLQEEFYNHLLQEAAVEMLAKENEKKKKGRKKKDEDEESSAEGKDSDDDDDDEDDEDDEDGDAAYIALLNTTLPRLEQFLVAPDNDEDFLNWKKRPSGNDLVSSAVRRMDELLDEHFRSIPQDRQSQEKVLVFSWNKSASVHFMKHSRWAKAALHYQAGKEEVVRRFKAENDKLVLFADEGSLREGENLQMCSRVYRMQPVWTPGDYKQAAARAYRPDPRGQFASREDVRHVWFIAEGAQNRPTVQGVKLGTMISKTINNARLKYEHDFDWRKVSQNFEDLKRLRVNFKLVFETEPEDIAPYFRKWRTFNDWIADRVQTAKIREAERLEREHNVDLIRNGKIIDTAYFLKLAMKPVTSKRTIPGSRRVYVPWEYSAVPADIYDLDLVVLGGDAAPVGTPVMTEFGAGIILNDASDRSVKVELYGGKSVTLRRLAVAVPSTDVGKRKLRNIVKSKSDWKATYISPKVRPSGTPNTLGAPVGKDEEVAPAKPKRPLVTPKGKQQAEEQDHVEIFTQILNGWPFLMVDAGTAPEALLRQKGWSKVEPFVAYTFRSWAQADKFLDVLAEKFFINQIKFDKLVEEMELLRDGRAMRLTKRVKDSEVRDFLRSQHRMKGKSQNGRYIIDPFWVAVEDTVYLAFDRKSHNSTVISWLARAAAKVTGMQKAKPNEGFYVYQFDTMSDAQNAIRNASKTLQFDPSELEEELEELKQDLKQFARRKATPGREKPASKPAKGPVKAARTGPQAKKLAEKLAKEKEAERKAKLAKSKTQSRKPAAAPAKKSIKRKPAGNKSTRR